MEIVELILSGALAWIGRRADRHGYAAILVDLTEIRLRLQGPQYVGLTRREVARRFGFRDTAIGRLVARGTIKTVVVRNPVTRCLITVVPMEEAGNFAAAHVALGDLATRSGEAPHKLLARLTAHGINPAFDPEEIGAVIFKRADLPD